MKLRLIPRPGMLKSVNCCQNSPVPVLIGGPPQSGQVVAYSTAFDPPTVSDAEGTLGWAVYPQVLPQSSRSTK